MSKIRAQYKSPLVWSQWLGLVVMVMMLGFFSLNGETMAAGTSVSSYEKPDVSSGFSRRLQGLFGMNTLARWIGNRHVEQELRKTMTGDLSVKLQPYSAVDLAQGKARSIRIEGNNVLIENAFYVSQFIIQSDPQTPIWIDFDSGQFKSPLRAEVFVRLRESDLNRSFETPALKDQLEHIEVRLIGHARQTIALRNSNVQFKTGRIRYSTQVGIAGKPDKKSLPLVVETGLEPLKKDKTRLVFKDLSIDPISGVSSMDVVEHFLSQAMKDLLTPGKLLPYENSTLYVQKLSIQPQEIRLNGTVEILPSQTSSFGNVYGTINSRLQKARMSA